MPTRLSRGFARAHASAPAVTPKPAATWPQAIPQDRLPVMHALIAPARLGSSKSARQAKGSQQLKGAVPPTLGRQQQNMRTVSTLSCCCLVAAWFDHQDAHMLSHAPNTNNASMRTSTKQEWAHDTQTGDGSEPVSEPHLYRTRSEQGYVNNLQRGPLLRGLGPATGGASSRATHGIRHTNL